MDRKANIIAYGTLWAVIALLAIGGIANAAHCASTTPDTAAKHAPRVCFPAAKWGPAPRSGAPCVKVTRVYEDGSFQFAVSDKSGTVRYTSGVGALDR
jgi:hypothetical protein